MFNKLDTTRLRSICLLISFLGILVLYFVISLSHADRPVNARQKYEEAKNLIYEYSGSGNNYRVAEKYAKKIYSADRDNPYSYLISAELKSRQFKDTKSGSEDEILFLTEKVFELDDSIAGAYVINAKLANIRGDVHAANENLTKAIALEPGNSEAWFERAVLEQNSGNYEKARDSYEKTILLHTSPDRQSNIYFWLGKLHLQNDHVVKANQAMRKSVELSPKAPWKLVNYSLFLSRNTSEYSEAAKYAQLALDQMEFGMARKALGMAMYAEWAEKYKNLDYKAVANMSRSEEVKLLVEIEHASGMPVREIIPLSMQQMPLSSIAKATALIGVY